MDKRPFDLFRFGCCELIPSAWILRREGDEVPDLPSQDFKLLCCLVENAPEVVTRERLLTMVGWKQHGQVKYLEKSISNLRKILGSKNSIRYIRDEGYKLTLEVIRGVKTTGDTTRSAKPAGYNKNRSRLSSSLLLSWLYSDEDLARIESSATGNSIWIISPDLTNVTEKDVIIEAVETNIRRGVVYTYIVPESDPINGILPGLHNLFRSNPLQLKLKKVPEPEFRLLSVAHVAVFNPHMAGRLHPEVYMELPIEEEDGIRIRGHWIKVAKESAKNLVGRFRPYAEAATYLGSNLE